MRTAIVVMALLCAMFLWALAEAAVVPKPWVVWQHGKALMTINMAKRAFIVEQLDEQTWVCVHYEAGVPKEPGISCITTVHLAQVIFQ